MIITSNKSRNIFGLILIVAGILLLLNNLDVAVFSFGWPVLIILAGVYLIYRSFRKSSGQDSSFSEFRILGDSSYENFSGEIDGTCIDHFFGDTSLNLSAASLKPGINRLKVSHFIGDIDIIVPDHMAVSAHASLAIGDVLILNRKHGGFFATAQEKTDNYETAERKLVINCSAFIGDVKIRSIAASGQ